MVNPSTLPRKVFIVVDPSQDHAAALERALFTYPMYAKEEGSVPPSLHVFVAVDMDNTDTSVKNDKLRRDRDWFYSKVLTPLEESGIEFNLELSWSSDWHGSIQKAAKECDADLIMMAMVKKPTTSEIIFNDASWKLLRTSPCPVLIVQSTRVSSRQNVLTAVNMQSHRPDYKELNDRVISRGRWITEAYGAKMHVVNAYESSLDYPDRTKLATQSNVDTANIHVLAGDVEDVIAKVAKDVNADILVLGVSSRRNRWRGNTIAKIITKVDCDMLAIPYTSSEH